MNLGNSQPVEGKWYSAIEAPVKAAQVWCVTGRLRSIYMAVNSSGGMAKSERGLDKVLIYLVIRIVWTFQCHELFSVGLYIYILPNIMHRRSISGNNTEQVLQLQITNLQDNLAVTGTNVGVGPGGMNQVTTGTSNTALGSGTGGAP